MPSEPGEPQPPKGYDMKHANIVGLDDLKLTDITEDQANAAARMLSAGAQDRDEFRLFMRMVRPAPHVVALDPSERRALPRRSA